MSTSKNWATAALVSCALLLSGCAALESMASDFAPSGEEVTPVVPSPVAKAPISTGEYDLVESCRVFFTGPIVDNVRQLRDAVQAPLTEERTGAFSSVSRNIGDIISKADEVSIAHLEAVRAPFDQALDGSIARPKAVDTAVKNYETACKEGGFKG
ncbi:hypothetical protein ACQEVI_12335 [Promicromonospora sp. CA-289599]|uniref:hypothetical protein n=1 Tax=Promicromonospora sp. CA-289599 TaxID=3240014 RepID=UPI003D89B81D